MHKYIKDKLEPLEARLLAIHPTYEKVEFEGGKIYHLERMNKEFYIHFSDGSAMEAGEFIYGSETRDILEEMVGILALCVTCKEPYTLPSTDLACFCSNSFHCCRECLWEAGRVTTACERCSQATASCEGCK